MLLLIARLKTINSHLQHCVAQEEGLLMSQTLWSSVNGFGKWWKTVVTGLCITLNFMCGYRHGLVGSLLDYTQRKYKGHKTIPAFIISDLEKEYEDNCQMKEKYRKFN